MIYFINSWIIVLGGDPLTNVIDFVTIATAGNAQDFGDATVSAEGLVASSSPTRGIIGGGLVSPQINNIMFITIATTGNATNFGDLTQARQEASGISNSIVSNALRVVEFHRRIILLTL